MKITRIITRIITSFRVRDVISNYNIIKAFFNKYISKNCNYQVIYNEIEFSLYNKPYNIKQIVQLVLFR